MDPSYRLPMKIDIQDGTSAPDLEWKSSIQVGDCISLPENSGQMVLAFVTDVSAIDISVACEKPMMTGPDGLERVFTISRKSFYYECMKLVAKTDE